MYDVGLGTAVGVVSGGNEEGRMAKGCGVAWSAIVYSMWYRELADDG